MWGWSRDDTGSGRALPHTGEASTQLLELVFDVADLMDEVRPDVVLTHPYEGGHSDHDATAFAVHLACGILRRDNVPTPLVLELT